METVQPHIVFRKPHLHDGHAIFELVKDCPPLDLNSRYLYFLQADHFADTCVVGEINNKLVGFISGYIRPSAPQSLFVWQVAVAPHMRGQKLAQELLRTLIKNQVSHHLQLNRLSTTISPSNAASQKLFRNFAKRYNLEISKENYLEADQFGEDGHEAERLYTLSAPKGQTFSKSIT